MMLMNEYRKLFGLQFVMSPKLPNEFFHPKYSSEISISYDYRLIYKFECYSNKKFELQILPFMYLINLLASLWIIARICC